MQIVPLTRDALSSARALLIEAYRFDQIGVVADEKLFGSDGARTGYRFGALIDDALVGVIAGAGRWIKVLAVAPAHRRKGIGTALLRAASTEATNTELRIADHPGNYLSPGIDVRDGTAEAFLAARGFHRVGEVENIRAPIAGNPLIDAARLHELQAAAATAGYECRRATAADWPALETWIAAQFAPVWAIEARRALFGPCHALHVALHKNSFVAFAAADGNNQGLGWFGPAGTDPGHRGKRLGETLLLACLLDVAALPEAGVIAWIGPKPFYQRAVGALDDRRFSQWDQRDQRKPK